MTDRSHGEDEHEGGREVDGRAEGSSTEAPSSTTPQSGDGGSAWPAPAGPAAASHPAPTSPDQRDTLAYGTNPQADHTATAPLAGPAAEGHEPGGVTTTAPPKKKANKALPLVAMLAVGALIGGAAGGLTTWVGLGAPVSSQLTLAARREGLLLAAGPVFGVDGAFERFLRVPFSYADSDTDRALAGAYVHRRQDPDGDAAAGLADREKAPAQVAPERHTAQPEGDRQGGLGQAVAW